MKTFLITLLTITCFTYFSQNIQGEIKYKKSNNNDLMKDKINQSLDSSLNDNEELNGQLEFIKAQVMKQMFQNKDELKELIFHSNVSVYKKYENDELSSDDMESTNVYLSFSEKKDKDILYIDNETKLSVIQKEFLGKKFLIKEDLSTIKWKLVDSRKSILGYDCMKAVSIDSNIKTIVWYTTQIPVSSGPEGMIGLPGMILYCQKTRIKFNEETVVNVDEVIYTIEAIKIDLSKIDTKKLKQPKKGKVLSSQEEYDKLIEEVLKNMYGGEGSGGNTIIIK